eukprot:TRINITY_DN5055_c0_g1_i3.p1 TRINITY_DN5055_c0_g1~~TRINITY_DN5055_c0_g1_i3.p1  ORF type:complete len:264 (+),score=45.35 TRINITY_DN5055_c0_g1_i3:45-836(+)
MDTPPLVLLTGVYPEPITLDNVIYVFEGEERPAWVDNQIDVVVDVGPDGVLSVNTELPPNYVGPTVMVKTASLEEGGKFLVLEGEDMRSASDLDRAPMFKEFRERNEKLYTLLQGLDWEHLSMATDCPQSLSSLDTKRSPDCEIPTKRRFSLSDSECIPASFDPAMPPHQLWAAIEEEVREELNIFQARTGPEIFDEVYSSVLQSIGANISLPNLVFPEGAPESIPNNAHNYNFGHAYFNAGNYGFNKPPMETNAELSKSGRL